MMTTVAAVTAPVPATEEEERTVRPRRPAGDTTHGCTTHSLSPSVYSGDLSAGEVFRVTYCVGRSP